MMNQIGVCRKGFSGGSKRHVREPTFPGVSEWVRAMPAQQGGVPMPYPRAHLYMLGVIAVIIVGFWPSYFAVSGNVPWQFHAHGIAASCWVLLVTAQSWTAHRKPQLPVHRAVGMASLFLFPFLIAGLAAITT